MFSTLVTKELKTMLLSKQFVISFIICSVLILLSFFVGVQNYKNARSQYEASISQHQQKLEQARHWQSIQQQLFLPPDPLSVLVSGISNDIGRKIELNRGRDLVATDSRFGDNTILAIFRTFDLEFMLSVVLTLFAIVFTYNSVNGEREDGTLSLLFSNSVPRATFILAKVSGVLLALIVPLLIPISLGLALLPVFGIPFDGSDWIRILLIIGAGILHFSFFALIGIAVSATVRSSSASFMTLLVIWIASVFIVPRAAVLIAGRAIEVPNSDQITAQKNRFRMQLFNEDQPKISGFKPKNAKDMQSGMQEFQKMMSELSEERAKKSDEFAKGLDENLINRQTIRDQVASWVARLSPTAAFTFTVNDLANAGLQLPKNFIQNAKSYRNTFDSFITQKTGSKNSGMVMIFESDGEQPSITISELPVFTYERADLSSVMNRVWIGLGLLAAFNALAIFVATVGFTQTDIR